MPVPRIGFSLRNLIPQNLCMEKNYRNWQFFGETYATKQDWVRWFHMGTDKKVDNRSYAVVVKSSNITHALTLSVGQTIQNVAPPPTIVTSNSFKDNNVLERHIHQSPVKNTIINFNPRITAVNIVDQFYTNNHSQVKLEKRFVPL